jgi:hypothetical protein
MTAHVMLVIAFIVLIPAMWFGLISLLAQASGRERLAADYPAKRPPSGTALHSRVGESRRGLLQALPYDLPRSRGNLPFRLADLSFFGSRPCLFHGASFETGARRGCSGHAWKSSMLAHYQSVRSSFVRLLRECPATQQRSELQRGVLGG